MKLRNYLESIAGVGIFPVITLVIFFAFFTLLSIWAIRARKEHLNAMNNLPFDYAQDEPLFDGNENISNNTQQA